ncbi:MAG: cobaltochelatase subunit CobN, partial [Candidatus Altarchaeum sp.]|nr:cobaltochelatase subunit CobN [Candidatus Altarchaeum sp.]
VYASAWKDDRDLTDVFIYWNGYGYGKGFFGKEMHKEFHNNLKTVDTTSTNTATDEYDIFDCCCHFGTEGGLCNAAKQISKNDVKLYHSDTRDPARVKVMDLADEIKRVVRTKILNPKWIEGQKRHGYKGAGNISKRIGRVYGWSATTKQVDKWIFDDITKTFVLDKEMREWFNENNSWALEEIERRLLEAEQRKLWNADPEMLDDLKECYMELEGIMEEKMGDVEGDYQGGAIDIFTDADVGDWKTKMDEIRAKIKTDKK